MSSSGVSCSFAPYITLRCLYGESCGFLGWGCPYLRSTLVNVSIHGDAEGPIGMPDIIIPSEVDSYKLCAFPVCGDLIVFLEIIEEMEGVLFSQIFHAEFVNN